MESTRQNNIINAINNARMLLNELRSNLSRELTKRIRDKLYKKETINNFLQEEDSLTNKENKVVKNIDRYPKNISMHLKKLKKHYIYVLVKTSIFVLAIHLQDVTKTSCKNVFKTTLSFLHL